MTRVENARARDKLSLPSPVRSMPHTMRPIQHTRLTRDVHPTVETVG